MGRARKLQEGRTHPSREAGPAVEETKYRKDTNSFSWRNPAFSFTDHAAILLLEREHFKHVVMLGIAQS